MNNGRNDTKNLASHAESIAQAAHQLFDVIEQNGAWQGDVRAKIESIARGLDETSLSLSSVLEEQSLTASMSREIQGEIDARVAELSRRVGERCAR